jgi:hypothetical protein
MRRSIGLVVTVGLLFTSAFAWADQGVADGSASGQTESSACTRAITAAYGQIPSSSRLKITGKECNCRESSDSSKGDPLKNPMADWSCTAFVTWEIEK